MISVKVRAASRETTRLTDCNHIASLQCTNREVIDIGARGTISTQNHLVQIARVGDKVSDPSFAVTVVPLARTR